MRIEMAASAAASRRYVPQGVDVEPVLAFLQSRDYAGDDDDVVLLGERDVARYATDAGGVAEVHRGLLLWKEPIEVNIIFDIRWRRVA